MNIVKIAVIALAMAVLTGCGQRVEIPAAHVGKVMTKHGYKEGYIPTSKFRLEFCMMYCDKLVLLDISDQAVNERMNLFMPGDRLTMDFEVRLTLAVKPEQIDEMFTRIPPTVADHGDIIPLNRAYEIYAQQVIRAEVREFLSTFTISEIASSREAVNSDLSARLVKSINDRTPFMVRYAGLADVKYPDIIVKAQENAAERREQIQQEEAQLEIARVRMERELEEQRMQRIIDVERANAEAEVNRILALSVTPTYVQYRSLNIMQDIASSDNKVFVPTEMLSSMAAQVALGNTAAR